MLTGWEEQLKFSFYGYEVASYYIICMSYYTVVTSVLFGRCCNTAVPCFSTIYENLKQITHTNYCSTKHDLRLVTGQRGACPSIPSGELCLLNGVHTVLHRRLGSCTSLQVKSMFSPQLLFQPQQHLKHNESKIYPVKIWS